VRVNSNSLPIKPSLKRKKKITSAAGPPQTNLIPKPYQNITAEIPIEKRKKKKERPKEDRKSQNNPKKSPITPHREGREGGVRPCVLLSPFFSQQVEKEREKKKEKE